MLAVPYPPDATDGELQNMILIAETTRNFVICYHTTNYNVQIIYIWFIYDPAVYLTETELG